MEVYILEVIYLLLDKEISIESIYEKMGGGTYSELHQVYVHKPLFIKESKNHFIQIFLPKIKNLFSDVSLEKVMNYLADNKKYEDTDGDGLSDKIEKELGLNIESDDTDGDGINFWANSDGNGAAYLKEVGGFTLKSFNGDFGGSIIYNFSVDSPLSCDQLYNNNKVELYPNPTKSEFYLNAPGINKADILIHNGLGQIFQLPFENLDNVLHFDTQTLAPGMYIVHIKYEGETITKKLIIQ